jgi:hypothetical protein
MESKGQYYEVMKAKLEEWEERFDLAKARAKSKAAGARLAATAEGRELPDDLRALRDRMRTKLEQLRDATEGSWTAIKREIEEAWDELTRYAGRFRKSA